MQVQAHESQINMKQKNNNNDAFQTYVVSGKSPGEMSQQTTRSFTFKIKVQTPSMNPSTATCVPVLRAPNVLGVYHKLHDLVGRPHSMVRLLDLAANSPSWRNTNCNSKSGLHPNL